MNLTDLQVELRAIEDHLSALQAEIEKMKPQPEEEKKAAFEAITKMAAQHPLKNKQLPKEMESKGKVYISSLAYITLADEIKLYDKLLYLCRLSSGMKLELSSEDILKMGMEIDKDSFDKACSELKELRYSFLTDALILANITEEATDDTFSLIADIAKIMECDKEELRAMAFVAKAVLTNNFDTLLQLPVPNKNRWMNQFRQHIPVSWVEAQRLLCGKYCTGVEKDKAVASGTSEVYSSLFKSLNSALMSMTQFDTVKSRLKAGSIVKKGDILVSYSDMEGKEKTIVSPCNGVVFLVEGTERDSSRLQTRKYVYVYVVSYFDDYTSFQQKIKNKQVISSAYKTSK